LRSTINKLQPRLGRDVSISAAQRRPVINNFRLQLCIIYARTSHDTTTVRQPSCCLLLLLLLIAALCTIRLIPISDANNEV